MQEVAIVEDAASRRWLADRMARTPFVIFKWSTLVVALLGVIVIASGLTLSRQALGLAILTVGAPVIMSGAILAAYPVVRWLPQTWRIDLDGINGKGRAFESVSWNTIKAW